MLTFYKNFYEKKIYKKKKFKFLKESEQFYEN